MLPSSPQIDISVPCPASILIITLKTRLRIRSAVVISFITRQPVPVLHLYNKPINLTAPLLKVPSSCEVSCEMQSPSLYPLALRKTVRSSSCAPGNLQSLQPHFAQRTHPDMRFLDINHQETLQSTTH